MRSPVAWLNDQLEGAPDDLVTVGLFVVAGVLIWVALVARPATKAGFLAWAVAP